MTTNPTTIDPVAVTSVAVLDREHDLTPPGADLVGDELLEDELLVEEISIDGMCGVY